MIINDSSLYWWMILLIWYIIPTVINVSKSSIILGSAHRTLAPKKKKNGSTTFHRGSHRGSRWSHKNWSSSDLDTPDTARHEVTERCSRGNPKTYNTSLPHRSTFDTDGCLWIYGSICRTWCFRLNSLSGYASLFYAASGFFVANPESHDSMYIHAKSIAFRIFHST